MLGYLFHPNPGYADYTSPKVLILFVVCIVFVLASFFVTRWRKGLSNTVTKKLSKSWASALRWFGITGVFLIICRVEQIQYFAMRSLWALWFIVVLLYVGLQLWFFKRKHYTVVTKEKKEDPREKYLPNK